MPERSALIERLARLLYAALVAGASSSEVAAIERREGLAGTALEDARRMARFAYMVTNERA
jgi:hypothetical protein